MCGIAGIFSYSGHRIVGKDISDMTDSIAHRGPDGEGSWISAEANIGLGHRRLAIIDLSPGGAQPMTDGANRYTITFNGEIYNYTELREKLEREEGIRFRSSSDTEVLMAIYARYGKDGLSLLDGMFAFAIWDAHEKNLFLARDRFGEKPLYYALHNGKLYFASEMKALFAGGVPRKLSDRRLHYYMAFNLLQDPDDIGSTFYEGVRQLPPAHFAQVNNSGKVEPQCYWQIDDTKQSALSFDASVEKFRELFLGSVSRRLRSDVPVGSSLSGGLDSSVIVLLIDQMKTAGQIQKTFSARFSNFTKDEGKYIKAVTDKAKKVQAFETWPDEQTLINDFDRICFHQEEPFGSGSIVAQWSVMQLAREQNVTVLIDGQGADEIMAGYASCFTPYLNRLYAERSPRFETERRALAEAHNYKFQPGRRLHMLLRYPKLVQTLSGIRRTFAPSSKAEPGYANSIGYHEHFYDVVRRFGNPMKSGPDNNSLRAYQKRMITQAGFQSLLRFADRNSMANARELRLPFLDHQLVEFCFSLDDSLKINEGWTKFLIRKAYENILPEEITWRKNKIGFEAPQENWMQNETVKQRIRHARELLIQEKIITGHSGFPDWKSLVLAQIFYAGR